MHGKALTQVFSLTLAASLLSAAGRAEPPNPAPPPAPGCLPAAEPTPAPCVGTLPAVRKHAAPSDTGSYIGYYVGGGVPVCGEPRHPDEGTWGWDYSGCYFHRCVVLFWTHGRLYQGGMGAYKSEGPKLLHHHEGHEKEGGH
jgi:hypothetical protein